MGKKTKNTPQNGAPPIQDPPKIVVMGSGGVGKSAITNRFVNKSFADHWNPTIEDFYNQTVTLEENGVQSRHQVEIIDTAGQDQFKAITNKYYRVGKAFIFVFALDDQNSLEYLKTNFEDLLRERGYDESNYVSELFPPVMIVGNKADLEFKQVPIEGCQSPEDLAQELGRKLQSTVEYLQVSAKTGQNIEEIFQKSLQSIFRKEEELIEKGKSKEDKKKCIIM